MNMPCEFQCDADYKVQWRVGGKKFRCPIYAIWDSMRARCSGKSVKARLPTYADVSCSPEWLRFSEFSSWVNRQPWQGMSLDKDILISGNKIYSKDSCAFVPHRVNALFTVRPPSKKGFPLGVRASNNGPNSKNPFEAYVNNGSGRSVFIGGFKTEIEAHAAYLEAKSEVIFDVVDWWRTDPEVMHNFQIHVATAMILRANSLIEASRSNQRVISI